MNNLGPQHPSVPFPLQLYLVKAESNAQPKTPLQQKMKNEVTDLREEEEGDAIHHMRQNHKRYVSAVANAMDEAAQQILRDVKNIEQRFGSKIDKDEKREEQMGMNHHDDAHDKNHGIDEHGRRVVQAIARHRNKERNDRLGEMQEWYKEKENNAIQGMRRNQSKDERQIVKLTQELESKRNKA